MSTKLKFIGGVILCVIFIFFYNNKYCSGHSYGVSCGGVLGGLIEGISNIIMWGIIFLVLPFGYGYLYE